MNKCFNGRSTLQLKGSAKHARTHPPSKAKRKGVIRDKIKLQLSQQAGPVVEKTLRDTKDLAMWERIESAVREFSQRSQSQMDAFLSVYATREDLPFLPKDVVNLLQWYVGSTFESIYLVGGLSPNDGMKNDGEDPNFPKLDVSNELVRLNVHSLQLESLASLPSPRWGHAVVYQEGEILVLGGSAQAAHAYRSYVFPAHPYMIPPLVGTPYATSVLIYSIANDSWREEEIDLYNAGLNCSAVAWQGLVVVSSANGNDQIFDCDSFEINLEFPTRLGCSLSNVNSTHQQSVLLGSLLAVFGSANDCRDGGGMTCCCSLHLIDLDAWKKDPSNVFWISLPLPSSQNGHIRPGTSFFAENTFLYLTGGPVAFDSGCCLGCETTEVRESHFRLNLTNQDLRWECHYEGSRNEGVSWMHVEPSSLGHVLIGGQDHQGVFERAVTSHGHRIVSGDYARICFAAACV